MSKYCPIYGFQALYLDCLECEDKIRCRRGNCKIMNKYEKVIIGIDQSYATTGLTIACDNEIKLMKGINLKQYENNSMKRNALDSQLDKMYKSIIDKGDEIICIIERIRLKSDGFLNINYIKSIGALNALIIDISFKYDIPVYSVDTRCWKSQVVGTSKPQDNKYGVDPKKWPTIQWCIDNGFKDNIKIPIPENSRKRKGTFVDTDGKRYLFDDNIADSAAIALFGFVGDNDKLILEK